MTEQALEKFRQIYFEKYGTKLSKKEASEKANRLLNLFKAVYLPEEIKININNNGKELQHKKNNK